MSFIKSKKFILPTLILVVLIIIAISIWQYVIRTPQYSIYQMYKTVQAHDYQSFIKYFDVDSIAENIVDKAFEETKETSKDEAGDNAWYELGKNFAEGLMIMMKPKLKEEFRNEIKKQIEAGDFRTDYDPRNLVKAFTKMKVQKDGTVAQVTLTNDEQKILSLKMRQMEGYWQVFDMDFDTSDLKIPEGAQPTGTNETTTENKYQQMVKDKIIIEANIGDAIELSTVNIKVKSATEKNIFNLKYGSPLVARENAKFAVFSMEVTNTTKDTFNFQGDSVMLVDSNERTCYPSNDLYSSDGNLVYRDLKPNLKESGILLYEIPNDSEDYALLFGKAGTDSIYKVTNKSTVIVE